MLQDLIDELHRYRLTGERALAQVPDAALNTVPAPDANSVAMLVRHMSGNLISRFTDFLTADGEKPWRARDAEFEERRYSRRELDEHWRNGWEVLERALASLSNDDLGRTVMIRGQPLTVHAALCRASTHMAYHVGQLVLLARGMATTPWQWISVPKGQSDAYNREPTMEKRPR